MEIYNDTYCVYMHTNKINGKKYVGQTCQEPEKRWLKGEGYRGCRYFYNAIKKYGWDAFEHEILASNLTKDEADNFEKLLIDKLSLMNPENGYNLKEGGSHGKLSEESKELVRQSKLGKPRPEYIKQKLRECNIGRTPSEETRRKMSESGKGRKFSEEHKRKISEANTGRKMSEESKVKMSEAHKGKFVGSDNPFYGKCHTEETKQILSEINKKRFKDKTNHPMYGKCGKDNPNYGKKRSEETKERMREARKSIEITDEQRQYISKRVSGENNPMYGIKGEKHPRARRIIQYDLNNNFIRYWDYIRQAAKELNIGESNITACCRGKIKHCYGFVWRYADDVEQ